MYLLYFKIEILTSRLLTTLLSFKQLGPNKVMLTAEASSLNRMLPLFCYYMTSLIFSFSVTDILTVEALHLCFQSFLPAKETMIQHHDNMNIIGATYTRASKLSSHAS